MVPIRELGYKIEFIFQGGFGGPLTEMMLNLNSLVGFGQDADGNDVINTAVQAALYLAADDFGARRRVCTYPAGTADSFRNGEFELYLKTHNYIVSHELRVDMSGCTADQIFQFAGKFVPL